MGRVACVHAVRLDKEALLGLLNRSLHACLHGLQVTLACKTMLLTNNINSSKQVPSVASSFRLGYLSRLTPIDSIGASLKLLLTPVTIPFGRHGRLWRWPRRPERVDEWSSVERWPTARPYHCPVWGARHSSPDKAGDIFGRRSPATPNRDQGERQEVHRMSNKS